MFLIGLRNIPRRVAQTVLIIIGLMLSTRHHLRRLHHRRHRRPQHHEDDLRHPRPRRRDHGVRDGASEAERRRADATSPSRSRPTSSCATRLAGDPEIDGIVPVLLEKRARAVNEPEPASAPRASTSWASIPAPWPPSPTSSTSRASTLDLATLADDEVYVNESMADELDAEPGDTVTVYYQNQPFRFTRRRHRQGQAC